MCSFGDEPLSLLVSSVHFPRLGFLCLFVTSIIIEAVDLNILRYPAADSFEVKLTGMKKADAQN